MLRLYPTHQRIAETQRKGSPPEGALRQPAIVYDARMRDHVNEANPSHPEQPDRISRIWSLLCDRGLVARCTQLEVGREGEGEREGGGGG